MGCEAIPRQINFLTDESGEVGKGANAVISRLRYFFGAHSLGETDVYLHADNCTGQNKNNAMINNLMWRVMTGRHIVVLCRPVITLHIKLLIIALFLFCPVQLSKNVTHSFLVVGHTKFSPDWCFGLFKRLFRRTTVDCMADIAAVVDNSAVCNVSQLVHIEDTAVVPTFDWASFRSDQPNRFSFHRGKDACDAAPWRRQPLQKVRKYFNFG